jgi:methionyl-tRNA synthetase
MAEVNFGNDGDFSDERMVQKVNTNLANELGNLCQRTLSMVFKNCGKAVPSDIGPYTPEDEALLAKARALREEAGQHISKQAIQKYVETMVTMIWESNKYIDEMAPWILKKTDPDRMETVLYVLLEVLRHAAILYQPLIPDAANKILDQLTVPADERSFDHLDDAYAIKHGAAISKPVGVFPRLEFAEEPVNA